MLLSARMLDGVSGVNTWNYVDQVSFTEGDAARIYFQLIDTTLDRPINQYKPAGRRFVPADSPTPMLKVALANIDDDKQVSRFAVQAFTGDGSIWYLDVAATDKVRGTVNMVLVLTEGSKITHGRLDAALTVANQGTL